MQSGIKFNKTDAFIDEVSLTPKHRSRSGDIVKSDELSGIELRLSRVLIKDNLTPKIPLFPGLAQMYLLIIVFSDSDDPIQNMDVKGFAKVDDDEELPIDRTIFYWKKTKAEEKNPSQIHALISVVKSKEKLREAGDILAKVKDDDDYSKLVGGLMTLLVASNPAGQIADSLFTAASIIGKYLGKVNDKPILTWVQSFTDINGDLDNLGKTDKVKENDLAEVKMTLIVRDQAREEKILAAHPPEIREELDPG